VRDAIKIAIRAQPILKRGSHGRQSIFVKIEKPGFARGGVSASRSAKAQLLKIILLYREDGLLS
jgi:hypothetical protein